MTARHTLKTEVKLTIFNLADFHTGKLNIRNILYNVV